MDFEVLCRLCGTDDSLKIDIFGKTGREKHLADKISACLPFEISENDLYPKSLCFKCIHSLDSFFDFRKICLDTTAKFESVIRSRSDKDDFTPLKVLKPHQLNAKLKEEYLDGDEDTPNPADFLEACLVSGESPNRNNTKEEDEGHFDCKVCGRLFNSKSSLTIHAKFHQEKRDEKESYSCFVCDKVFSSKGHLALHSRVHIGETSSPPFSFTRTPAQIKLYRCDLCSKSYSMAKHLWGHVSTAHKGDPLVTCGICLRTFSSISNLELHKKVKHGDLTVTNVSKENEETDLQAENKEESPTNKRKSSKPRKIEREPGSNSDENNEEEEEMTGLPQMVYSCFLCSEKFQETQSLTDHLHHTHGYDGTLDYSNARMENDYPERMVESETMFRCEICIREFNDRASLWLHMLYSHRDEASKACGICLKICDDNDSLALHVEMSHPRDKTEQRRYSCQVCARQHDSRKKLVTHAKIHKLIDEDGNLVDPELVVVLNSEFYHEVQPSTDDGFMSSCDVCFKIFENEAKLVKHKRSAHRDGNTSSNSTGNYNFFFVCEICGLSHLSRAERWKHMASLHAGEPSITCQIKECGKVFPTSTIKNEHETSHHALQGQYPNTCEICGKMWKTRVEYWKHMMGVHSDYLPFICGVCLKVFCNISSLVTHVKDLHMPLNGGDFCCDICGRPYSKVSKMTRHRKIHYVLDTPPEIQVLLENASSDEPKMVPKLICDLCEGSTVEYEDFEALGKHRFENHQVMPCDLCSKYYGRTSHLWKHVNKIHKGHPDITCPTCEKTSASKSHLLTHIAKHHKKENSENDIHSCVKCNKIFGQKPLLKKHLKHCQRPKESEVDGKYDCERCNKSFTAQKLLFKHIRTSHLTYSCEICFTKVESRTDLYEHICQNHSDHPDVKCALCEKIFRNKIDLNRHQKDHRQSYHQSHICVFCAEIVSSKIKLRQHMKKHHGKFTKCLCAICLKALPSFQELKSHVETDHQVALSRPNACPVCGKPCSNKNKLMEHIKGHSMYFHPCKICLKIFATKDDLTEHLNNHPSDGEEEDQIEEVELDANSIMDIIGAQEGERVCVKRQIDDDKEETITVPPIKKSKTEFPCETCQETFIFMDDYLSHQETHKEPESILEKALIEKVEKSVEKSPQHITQAYDMGRIRNNRKVYCNDFTPSQCEICGKVWPAKRHLWQHLIRFHRIQAGTSCGICLKLCQNYVELSNHLVLEHPNNFDCDGTNLSCRVCGKYHNARSKLQNHASIHVGHEERAQVSSHLCLLCDTSFPLFKLFCEHNKEAHNLSESIEKTEHIPVQDTEKKFPFNSCDICSLVFASEQGLINHKRTHSQNDNYKCGQCGELFNSAVQLTSHKDEKHRGTEFVCADCKSNFTTYIQLTEHNKICKSKINKMVLEDDEYEEVEEEVEVEEEEEEEFDSDLGHTSVKSENSCESLADLSGNSDFSEDEEMEVDNNVHTDDEDMEVENKVTQEEPRAIEAYVCDNMVEVVKVDISDEK